MNSTMRVDLSESNEFAMSFVANDADDTILIVVMYLPGVHREVMNRSVETAKKIIRSESDARGWSSWLKVQERVVMKETAHCQERRIFDDRTERAAGLIYSEEEAAMERSNDPRHDFYANPTVDELIAQQRREPIRDPRTLLGDFWPEDEPIEEFLAALRRWRGHDKSDRAA
jgi:hypothetical protein